MEALEKLLERERVAAVYTTPHHQYPTAVTLTAPRRLALLDLARRHGFVVIEDDYDHEHHYDGRAVLPLASVDGSSVAYVGATTRRRALVSGADWRHGALAKITDRRIASDDWAARALERKVLVHPGRRFRFDGHEAPFLRLGFAPSDARRNRPSRRALGSSHPEVCLTRPGLPGRGGRPDFAGLQARNARIFEIFMVSY